MKYGDTLVQRSIPEWGHYNIDYDYLKDLIKQHTTPGQGTAVSIPGQGATTETAFRDSFFDVLKAQHDRINLFVKSKSGEIDRRLDYIARQLAQLQARQPPTGPLPAKAIENYAKIDADAHRAGEEIRSLSRFQTAQRTGFYKILKKYKRWAKDHELERQFKRDVTGKPDSFFHLDLGYLLERYIEVLDALRAALARSDESSPRLEAQHLSPASRLFTATQRGEPLDFDVAVSAVPLGTHGSRATYWVHPDYLVEVEVLLLQHLRPFTRSHTAVTSPRASRQSSPFRQRPCTGVEDEVGFVVLDEPHAFAHKHNGSTVGASEEVTGVIPSKAGGLVKWTAVEPAAVVMQHDSRSSGPASQEHFTIAKVLRRQIEGLFSSSGSPASTPDERAAVRSWLQVSNSVQPIVSVGSKRTRFIGLNNSTAGGKWAVLDKDITMETSLPPNLCREPSRPDERPAPLRFPYAVLEVRREGAQSRGLIELLDASHLVERVRGFSLEAHAVWACCRPDNMSPPTWISLLENKDIRKLPEPVKRQRRKGTSTTDSGSVLTGSRGSTSATNATSPHRSQEASVSELTEPPPLRAFKKKRKQYAEYLRPDDTVAPQPTTRYWNEYDNPESEDEGYYIYIDPNASTKLPGQELFEAALRKTRALFRVKKEEAEGVSRLSTANTSSSIDEEDTSDESPLATPRHVDYGTLAPPAPPERRPTEGYFSSLFHTFSRPWRADDDDEEAQALRWHDPRARETLLIEIHARRHEREMAILKLYSSCLAAAATIDVILSVLVTASRRKLRGEVDVAVLLGVVANLVLVIVAVTSFLQRRERVGWVHGGVVVSLAVGMVVVDVVLLRWAVVP